MSAPATYQIRRADADDVPACLALWGRKERALTSAGVTQRHGAEDGDQVIARWAEQGQLYVATDAAGTVVACFALAGIDPDFWTPAEAVLVAEHAELQQRLADRSASDRQPSVHDAPAQAGGLGPLRRAIREIAHTRDDLATARDLAADDDTFAVEAGVLERRLPQLEAHLLELQTAADNQGESEDHTIWAQARELVLRLKLDDAASPQAWNAALEHAADALRDRARTDG